MHSPRRLVFNDEKVFKRIQVSASGMAFYGCLLMTDDILDNG